MTTRAGSPASRSMRSSSSSPKPFASRVSNENGRPRRSATISAVCAARILGEVMIASGLKPTPARKRPSRSACFSPFGGQRPGLVGTVPRFGIAGVRVADEMQLGHGHGAAGLCEGHGLRSSTSPVTR